MPYQTNFRQIRHGARKILSACRILLMFPVYHSCRSKNWVFGYEPFLRGLPAYVHVRSLRQRFYELSFNGWKVLASINPRKYLLEYYFYNICVRPDTHPACKEQLMCGSLAFAARINRWQANLRPWQMIIMSTKSPFSRNDHKLSAKSVSGTEGSEITGCRPPPSSTRSGGR
jgi:hypothetical protein